MTYLAMRVLDQYLHFETAFFDRPAGDARRALRRAHGVARQRRVGRPALRRV